LLLLDSSGLAAADVLEQAAAAGVCCCSFAPRLSYCSAVCWVGRSFAAGSGLLTDVFIVC